MDVALARTFPSEFTWLSHPMRSLRYVGDSVYQDVLVITYMISNPVETMR